MNILALITAYLLGSIPFGYLLVRWKEGGADVRQVGSGGTGATNVMRKAGKAAGIITLALDALKGFAAVWLARWLTGSGSETTWLVAAAAAVAIIGHVFPVWLGFRAGKGAATGLGVFLAITPLSVLSTFAVFLLIVKKTRYVSLGSIVATGLTPLWALLWNGLIFPRPDLVPIVASICAGGAVIIAKHASNIRRLIAGTENKFGAAH
jgi:glycerol-3-phosphate acyltransferase PlsY